MISSRKKLLKESNKELRVIKNKLTSVSESKTSNKFDRPPYSNRWGDMVFDPDISKFDYDEMRKKDPTLPEYDPRYFGKFTVNFDLGPAQKWLYFSDDLGSYAERLKKVTTSDARKYIYPGYYPDLLDKLPNDIVTILNNKSKYKGIIGRLIYFLDMLI